MKIGGKHYYTIWFENGQVHMIDQNALPFDFRIHTTTSYTLTCEAIRNMTVRGAGAIGAAAAFAMAQAFLKMPRKAHASYIEDARKCIESTRPTARDLFHATEAVYNAGINGVSKAVDKAIEIAMKNAADGEKIGESGQSLLKDGSRILTHCNAGWLGLVDWGSALAPVYKAHEAGKNVFVLVDETRPRLQGARLTAWELQNAGIPFKIIPDNAAAHFMSIGEVDIVITGADRIAANGDTANKIGTLEKAIAANRYGIPFYIAAPSSTFDLSIKTGAEIPIENRHEDEVLYFTGPDEKGMIRKIRTASPGAMALNPAFDVTPASLISGYITEKGVEINDCRLTIAD